MKKTYVIIVMLIGFFLALITMPAHAATCNVTVLQQKLDQYASIAMSMVNSTDKSIVLNAVSEYPEGSSPPTFTTLPDGQPKPQIIGTRTPARIGSTYRELLFSLDIQDLMGYTEGIVLPR